MAGEASAWKHTSSWMEQMHHSGVTKPLNTMRPTFLRWPCACKLVSHARMCRTARTKCNLNATFTCFPVTRMGLEHTRSCKTPADNDAAAEQGPLVPADPPIMMIIPTPTAPATRTPAKFGVVPEDILRDRFPKRTLCQQGVALAARLVGLPADHAARLGQGGLATVYAVMVILPPSILCRTDPPPSA